MHYEAVLHFILYHSNYRHCGVFIIVGVCDVTVCIFMCVNVDVHVPWHAWRSPCFEIVFTSGILGVLGLQTLVQL